jgi:DeoR family fructose operon transcriptional repressor
MVGGEVLPERKAVYGPLAEEGFKKYRARKAFIGVDGFSQQNGLSAYDEKEARNTQCMIQRADQVFLLCDSTKLERDSSHIFAPLNAIDILVTDNGITSVQRDIYRKNKIQMLIA